MLKRVLAHYAGGLCAGTLIAIGGGVFLGCRSMGNVGQIAGAVLFTVALLCICLQGYALYTGRIGFIPEKHDAEALSALFLGLAGNLSATMLWGLAGVFRADVAVHTCRPARQLGRSHASAPAGICRQGQASRVTVIRKEHTGT